MTGKNQNFLTKEGLEKLKKEHDYLNNIKRPKTVERLAVARGQGDLTENSEYAAARDELNFIDDRIAELADVLKNAKTYSGKKTFSKVDIGSKVVLKIDQRKETFFIVSEFESDPSQKKISFKSPLGQALIGKKKGETVLVETPNGKFKYKILTIE